MKTPMKISRPRRNILALFAIPILMFGFGYLMVPIYDIFCEITGLNGKTGRVELVEVKRMRPDETRLVTVEFMANLNRDTPIDFGPAVASMQVHPGKAYQTVYRARNTGPAHLVSQAVPSVSPSRASTYFNKTECFCFTQQEFTAHESRDLPVRFVIHPDLPADIDTVTLAYTFFEVAGDAESQDKRHRDNSDLDGHNSHGSTTRHGDTSIVHAGELPAAH